MKKFEVKFRKVRKVHTWIRFAESKHDAWFAARDALEEEYGEEATLMSVAEVPQYSVLKLYLGQYKFQVGNTMHYHVPPGWAVVDHRGLPIVWKNDRGAENCEVYCRKYIAQQVADYYNDGGFKHADKMLPVRKVK